MTSHTHTILEQRNKYTCIYIYIHKQYCCHSMINGWHVDKIQVKRKEHGQPQTLLANLLNCWNYENGKEEIQNRCKKDRTLKTIREIPKHANANNRHKCYSRRMVLYLTPQKLVNHQICLLEFIFDIATD